MLTLRSLSRRETTVKVSARAIVRTSSPSFDSRNCFSSSSNDISLKYACNTASCWLSEVILCSFLRSARLKKIAMIARVVLYMLHLDDYRCGHTETKHDLYNTSAERAKPTPCG